MDPPSLPLPLVPFTACTPALLLFGFDLTTLSPFRFLDEARGRSRDAAEAMAKFYKSKPPCRSIEPKAAAAVGAFTGADPAPFVAVAIDARQAFGPEHGDSAANHERALSTMKAAQATHTESAAQEKDRYKARKAREVERLALQAQERERENEAHRKKVREAREVRGAARRFGLTNRGIGYQHLSNTQGGIGLMQPNRPPVLRTYGRSNNSSSSSSSSNSSSIISSSSSSSSSSRNSPEVRPLYAFFCRASCPTFSRNRTPALSPCRFCVYFSFFQDGSANGDAGASYETGASEPHRPGDVSMLDGPFGASGLQFSVCA